MDTKNFEEYQDALRLSDRREISTGEATLHRENDELLLEGSNDISNNRHTLRREAMNQQVAATERATENNKPELSTGRRNWPRCELCVYHWLCVSVIVVNITIIVTLLLKRRLPDNSTMCLDGVAGTLALCVVVRQDKILNTLYHIIGLIPHSTPLFIRRHAAHLYHLGGIHSGAAISASGWLIMFNIAVVRSFLSNTKQDASIVLILVLASMLDLLVLLLGIFSFPAFRHRYHDLWEGTHRFSGWIVLLIFWSYLIPHIALSRISKPDRHSWRDMTWASPSVYFATALTISIALSWTPGWRLRRITPRYEKLSDHAIMLHYDGWHVKASKTRRLAVLWYKDWHAFACIPYPNGRGHSLMISRAGDWTSRIIDDPPKYLWHRGEPVQGVLYMAKIFRSVFCVGTGSGIAPIIALSEMSSIKLRVLWSTRDPQSTYSREIVERVYRVDENAVIFDTAISGRPDMVARAIEIYHAEGIEAVFVVSNAAATREMVGALKAQAIPTYGPIFDS